MPLIYVVGVLIVVGVLLWLVNTYIPMDGKIKSILNAVVVIAVVIYLLQIFGLLGTLQNIKVGHIAGTSALTFDPIAHAIAKRALHGAATLQEMLYAYL